MLKKKKKKKKRTSWWKLTVRWSLAGRHGGVIHGVTEVVLEEAGVRGTNRSRVGRGYRKGPGGSFVRGDRR